MRSIECVLWSCPAVPSTMLSRGRRASGARAAGAQALDRSRSVTRAAGRTRRSALDPHQRHRACPVRPEAQYADPRVTRPRGELVCSLRRNWCAASTSEAFTLRGHGGSFLAPSPSVIEGSFDISKVDTGIDAPICQDGRSGGFTELLARAEVSHDAVWCNKAAEVGESAKQGRCEWLLPQ